MKTKMLARKHTALKEQVAHLNLKKNEGGRSSKCIQGEVIPTFFQLLLSGPDIDITYVERHAHQLVNKQHGWEACSVTSLSLRRPQSTRAASRKSRFHWTVKTFCKCPWQGQVFSTLELHGFEVVWEALTWRYSHKAQMLLQPSCASEHKLSSPWRGKQAP